MIGAIALLSAAALLLLLAVGLAILTVVRRRSWDETEAEILESSIESFTDAKKQRKYRGMFLLRYRALNDMREALVRSGTESTDRAVIAKYVEARPLGSRVRIHFDPHAPGQVTISFSSGAVAFARAGAAALAGLGLGIIGAALLYLAQSPEW
jgi:hypothetical protein